MLITVCVLSSLGSPLLLQYLKELLPQRFSSAKSLSEVEVAMQHGVLLFSLDKQCDKGTKGQTAFSGTPSSVALSLTIEDDGRSLLVSNLKGREPSGSYLVVKNFNLGSETNLKELKVADSRILIEGDFLVTP